MSFWTRIFSRKESQARIALAMNQVGQPVQTPRNYEAFSREGYQVNVIGFKCVSLISRACAGIPWDLKKKSTGVEIESHPLLDLIKKPNPIQGQSGFIEALIAYYMIAGNSYVEANVVGSGPPTELWPIRPDKMKIIPGRFGLPEAYEFTAQSKKIIFPSDPITGQSNILHMKTFHPTDPWYGMSPIEAAVYSIDQHNESGKWNTALLQNSAVPSGALVVKQDSSNPMGVLTAPQLNNIREEVHAKYASGKNAGRIMILEGGMDWRQMGLNAKDMDWLEGRKMSAREICLTHGVPPIMLNIPGDSTFSNYKEARVALYEDTIIPLMDYVADEFNKWLTPRFGDDLVLCYDKDQIEALAEKRMDMFAKLETISYITDNEKRLAVGYDPVDGGDVLLKQSSLVPISDITDPPEPVPQTPPAQVNPDPSADNQDAADAEDPVDDSEADMQKQIHFKQINPLTKKDKVNVWKTINAQRRELEQAMYHDLKDSFDEMAKDLGEKLKNVDPRTAEFAALKVIADHSPKMRAELEKNIKRSLRVFGQNILSSGKSESKSVVKFNQFVDSFVKKQSANSIQHIEGTSIKKARSDIKKILSESLESGDSAVNIANDLQDKFESLSDSRARTIARTEVSIASNQGALEAAKALDLPGLKKEWVSIQDDRTRDNPAVADHLDMNGVRVELDEKFVVPPDTSMDAPGDPSAPPEQVINCRCVQTFSRDK